MDSMNGTVSTNVIFKGVQVLVVDNDRDSCYLYATLLSSLGAIVTIANSIKEALEVLRWFLPNILICEMRFYGESIYTLTAELSGIESTNGNHIPTIAVTAWVGDRFAQILEASFEGYLLKPIDLDQLVSLVTTFVLGQRNYYR